MQRSDMCVIVPEDHTSVHTNDAHRVGCACMGSNRACSRPGTIALVLRRLQVNHFPQMLVRFHAGIGHEMDNSPRMRGLLMRRFW